MRPEQLVFPAIRQLGNRPRLAARAFGRARWGNPFDPQRFVDPHALLELVKDDGPVTYHRLYRHWFVTGHEEAQAVLLSPDTSVAAAHEMMMSIRPYTKLSPLAKSYLGGSLLLNDSLVHTRLRSIVNRAFTAPHIETFEPKVRAVAQDLIASMIGAGETDVISGFAAPLPAYAIADVLGLPRDDWEWLRLTSDHISGLLDPFFGFDPDEINHHLDDLHRYFLDLANRRRGDPQQDLMSLLAQAQDGDVMSTDELVAMIGFMMLAGHETLTYLLGNCLIALAAYPDQRELLRTRPELIGNAVEELCRFDTSVILTRRTAIGTLHVGGRCIPAGANIVVMFSAANRDRCRWVDADRLRLDRADPRPLTFSHGIHQCLGAALARLELRVALPVLLQALGDYTIDVNGIEWKRSGTLHGPRKLPVQLCTAPRRAAAGECA